MASFNKVILAGNLTRDPEMRYTPTGLAIARFGLAINRTTKNEAGETKEEVIFVDIDAFGRQAEVVSQYFKKGKPILIEGRLKLDQWEDKNTHQKQSKLKVILEGFSFIDSGRAETGVPGEAPRPRPPAAPGTASPAPTAAPTAAPTPAPAEEPPAPAEDDVPF